ncbi:MAG TPA: thiamine diphosphokinase [Caproiciproducens sp.]|nr:thiamine diphosphokinase [Caproiciproducens sp.]
MGHEVKQCVIIGSSPCVTETEFLDIDRKNFYVVCADGGYDTALRFHVKPDLIVGDFDSLTVPLPDDIETIRLKIEKDDTDIMAAVRIALERGYRRFLLLGALGGRLDHSFANFCILQYLAEQNCSAVISGMGSRVYFLNSDSKNNRLELNGLEGKTVSVFPFGVPVCTVTYEGLKYRLVQYPLTSNFPLGVSNLAISEKASVLVHDGSALVMVIN